MKHTAILIFLAFLLGSCMGSRLSDQPEVEFIEVPRTKIVTEPAPPPKEIPVFPESCQKVMALADGIARNAEQLYSSGQEQLAILSDGRLYMAARRNTDPIETRQRRLHGRTVGILFDLEKQFALYDTAIKECESDND